MKKNYKVIVYEVEEFGMVTKTLEDDFTTKKIALEYYKNVQRNEERHIFFWNPPEKIQRSRNFNLPISRF